MILKKKNLELRMAVPELIAEHGEGSFYGTA